MMKLRLLIVLIAGIAMIAASCGDDGTTSEGLGSSDPVDGSIAFTDAWKGEWNIVIVFKDCTTGDTLNVEDITDVICDGDTLDLQLTDLFEDCDGTLSDTRLMVDCAYTFSDLGCTVDVSAELDVERMGDNLMGTGRWSVTTTGSCTPAYIEGCEDLVITGMRIDPDPADCVTPFVATEDFLPAPRIFTRPFQR